MARTTSAATARKLGIPHSVRKDIAKKKAVNKKAARDLVSAKQELRTVQRMLGLKSAGEASLREAVFICIDCEAFEFSPKKITEIGISILDTKVLDGIAPGEDAQNWLSKVKSAHYRPIQHAKFRNKRWIRGCEHGFNFGTTQWINVDDATKLLTRVFSDPTQLDQASNFDEKMATHAQNIVLVGHDLSNDVNFLNHLGFSLSEEKWVVRTFDTAKIARAATGHKVGLHSLLLSLDMQPVNLHNGGNDAAYTLQALILMAFKDYRDSGSVFSRFAAQPKELPDLEYNNQAAPHVFAGSVKVDKLDANTKHIVHEACKVPNSEIYRKVKQPSASAKVKPTSTTENSNTASQAQQTPVRSKSQKKRDRKRRKKAREAAAKVQLDSTEEGRGH